jgi:NitT/TauT family transport system ATP-binding protein
VVKKYIELVGLQGFESRFPQELSGGMRQRCALARTLANDPDLLLMDEPFAAVDAQTRELLQEELLKIWGEHLPPGERKTVIFVTHSIDEAVFLSDRVVVMSARPGVIKEGFVNPLPRPRTEASRSSPEYLKARDHLWGVVKVEALKAMQQRFA